MKKFKNDFLQVTDGVDLGEVNKNVREAVGPKFVELQRI